METLHGESLVSIKFSSPLSLRNSLDTDEKASGLATKVKDQLVSREEKQDGAIKHKNTYLLCSIWVA